jgi:polyhydroxyalkanoate synthesis repressor PhaR
MGSGDRHLAKGNAPEGAPVTIKKYANRRLYNTATSSYVTLDHLSAMVKGGQEFLVYDAKTGEDITRSVLTQIIFEEESKGQNLLPIRFLRQLIGFYGDSLQAVVPNYLEMSMESFSRNQEQYRKYLTDAFGEPFRQLEEMGRQNVAMFHQALSMFTPFTGAPGEAAGGAEPRKADAPEDVVASNRGELQRLRQQVEDMQRRLEQIASGKKG